MNPSAGIMIRNAVPVSQDEIPILEIDSWRSWIFDTCKNKNGRIVSLFALEKEKGLRLFAILGIDAKGELFVAATDLENKKQIYPALTPDLPEAHLFEREMAESFPIHPEGHPWLKPVRGQKYPFYSMEGESLHEVAVGPVHAGIIEPGHFRFQCHGEKVFHLEIQLGYQHRGIEKMMPSAKPSRQMALAESIAGDTVIGHGLAYVHAIEGFCGRSVTQGARRLRAITLELERLANHVGDLGALAADIGYLTASAYFGRLRGEFLNLLLELSGNRFGRSFLKPGGVSFGMTKEMVGHFKKRLMTAASEIREVSKLFFSSSMVLSRLEQTGTVSAEMARMLGLVGPAARASNLLRDIRSDYPTGVYRFHYLPPVRLTTGDVYARARIRSLESKRSIEFILEQLDSLSHDKIFQPCGISKPSALIASLIEGWRGEIAHIALTDSKGSLEHYKVIDPSFRNWMGLAMAMRDGQISDFPLCNKSFNFSYAGHDL